MNDPFHVECPHELPEGWQAVVVGSVRENHKIWDCVLQWVPAGDCVGKPVANFGTVIEPKPWGPMPEPGDIWSFGGREMIYVGLAHDFMSRDNTLVWIDQNSRLKWLTMTRTEFYESGIKTDLMSKGHDVPRYTNPGTTTAPTV